MNQANETRDVSGADTASFGRVMNGLYEITKPCSVRELEAMYRLVEDKHAGVQRDMYLHCINETIRRKLNGEWQ